MSRPSWARYFMNIAHQTAARMSCNRAKVGCVLVDADNQIISTGYGGAPRGVETCESHDHLMEHGHCVRTIHAEHNAVLQAARRGVATDGATCYCTHLPCFDCCKVLIQAGIKEIVYEIPYRREDDRSLRAMEWLDKAQVEITHLPPESED